MLERIGRYRLIKRVGAGGQATVYSAEDTLLRRTVAVKVMNQLVSLDPQYAETVLEEARFASQLAHRNIAAVYDFIQEQDYVCIVMELIENSVDKEIESKGHYEVKDALILTMQIASALRFAHSKRFVHRDIKPQNILISSDGEAKVTDFGMSRPLDVSSATGSMGTLKYMAPEQLSGEHLPDVRSDLYSVGITLYEMLSGAAPFNGTFSELYSMHVNQNPPAFDANLDIPKIVSDLVFKCLEKDPDDRFNDCDSLISKIEETIDLLRQPILPARSRPSVAGLDIICDSCGLSNETGMKFCVGCGEMLDLDSNVISENQVPPSPAPYIDPPEVAPYLPEELVFSESEESYESMGQTWRAFGPHTILGTVPSDEIEHYGIFRTVQAGADEYVFVRKNGEIKDVFSEERKSTRSFWEFALNSFGIGPRIEIFKTTRTRFNLTFWLGEDDTLVTGNKNFTFGLPVLTRDKQVVSGKINLWLQVGDSFPENLLLLLRGEPAINKFDIASEIRDDLHSKVLGMDITHYDWEDLRGNRELLEKIGLSVQREITGVVEQFGLLVQDCSISWGLSMDETSALEQQKHEASLQAIENINEIERMRSQVNSQLLRVPKTHSTPKTNSLIRKKIISTTIATVIVIALGFLFRISADMTETDVSTNTTAPAVTTSPPKVLPTSIPIVIPTNTPVRVEQPPTPLPPPVTANALKTTALPPILLTPTPLVSEKEGTFLSCLERTYESDFTRASMVCKRALELDPTNVDIMKLLGLAYNGLENYSDAVSVFDSALSLNPNDDVALEGRGIAYNGLERFELALIDLTAALEINSSFSDTYRERALAYYGLGQFDKAMSDVNTALELEPADFLSLLTRAVFYQETELYNEALEDLGEAIILSGLTGQDAEEVESLYAPSYFMRGVSYREFEDSHDYALADFNRCIQIDSTFAPCYEGRGSIYLIQGRLDAAIQDLNEGILLAPDYPDTYAVRGMYFEVMSEPGKALKDYKTAQQLLGFSDTSEMATVLQKLIDDIEE